MTQRNKWLITAAAAILMVTSTMGLPFFVVTFFNESAAQNQKEDGTVEIRRVDDRFAKTMKVNRNILREEDYLTGVLAAEVPASFHPEALKAQAVAARSYYYYRTGVERHQMSESPLNGQKYVPVEQMRAEWGEHYDRYEQKLRQAVRDTRRLELTYQGGPVLAAFFSSSNGSTESSEYIWGKHLPYLQPVRSPWEAAIGRQKHEVKTISWTEMSRVFGIPASELRNHLRVIRLTSSGRSDQIRIGKSQTIHSATFREKLKLNSTDIKFQNNPEHCVIITRGYGHGAGMSQWGAEALARNGWTAEQILQHYYPGTQLMMINREK